jgi:hypothetical protein
MEIWQNMHNKVVNAAHKVGEYVTPVLTESHFADRGVLTPEEFVAAGDQLVHKCPTWSWSAGDASCRRPYLPADKQFLITRNVPCLRRVTALEADYKEDVELSAEDTGGSDGWLATHSNSFAADQHAEEIGTIGTGMLSRCVCVHFVSTLVALSLCLCASRFNVGCIANFGRCSLPFGTPNVILILF